MVIVGVPQSLFWVHCSSSPTSQELTFGLFLGMGTEVVVFFLSAFDRPFDKTDDGKEIPTHFQEDDEEIETVGINTKATLLLYAKQLLLLMQQPKK